MCVIYRTMYSMDITTNTTNSSNTVIRWVCGPIEFINKYQLLQEISSQFPSGMSQSIMLALVKYWEKFDGLHMHVQSMQLHYKQQKEYLMKSLRNDITNAIGMYIYLCMLCTYGTIVTDV